MNRIKYFAAIAAAIITLSGCAKKEEQGVRLSIIPEPSSVIQSNGAFAFYGSDIIAVQGGEELMNSAEYLKNKLAPATGYDLKISDNSKGRITLKLSEGKSLPAEGYRLSVTPGGVTIEGADPAGVFYGVQTLLQLFPAEIKSSELQKNQEWEIPCVEITDSPRFGWRGVMLDVSRHFFTKEEVLRYIDQIAEYKMNIFHWHLVDDQGWRIEIKSCPELVAKGSMRASRVGDWWSYDKPTKDEPQDYGGYYTQDDIREVLDYATKRYITVVPEIDVPGHSLEVLVAYPELACFKAEEVVNVGNKFYMIDENSLCVGNEKSFELMDKVLTEVAELFPSEYIHIGGDECYKGFWAKCPKCRKRMAEEKLKDVNELQSYFIRRMEKSLKDKGKKLIGWDEILEGGLAPEATVMSWRGNKGGIAAAKMGHHVIMTPQLQCYIDLYQGEPSAEPGTYSMCRLSDSYGLEPIPDSVNPAFILGGQGNLWTEAIQTFRHVEYMSYPRVWALAEVFWSKPENKNWNTFVPKVEEHFNRAENAKINYSTSFYHPIVKAHIDSLSGKTIIELSCEIDGVDIYYTVDNTLPDDFTPKYEKPFAAPKGMSRIQAVTYRNGKQLGKIITVEKDEIAKRAAEK